VLGQLVLAHVGVEVGVLHPPQGQLKPLAGLQPLVEAVPGGRRDEAVGGVATLVVEGLLGLAGSVQGQLVHLVVEGGRLLLQEQVQLVAGELVPQEVVHLARLLDLTLMVVELTQGDVAAALGGQDLPLDLLQLQVEHLHLMTPLLLTPLPGRLGQA
jgi:hypothetical protein